MSVLIDVSPMVAAFALLLDRRLQDSTRHLPGNGHPLSTWEHDLRTALVELKTALHTGGDRQEMLDACTEVASDALCIAHDVGALLAIAPSGEDEERLARVIWTGLVVDVGAGTGLPWEEMPELYKDNWRAMAARLIAHGVRVTWTDGT